MGGYLGMLISYGFLGKDGIAVIKPGSLDYSGFYVFFVELFFTILMMLVIISGKNAKLSLFSDMVLGCLASIIGIRFSAGCTSNLTAAVFNPNMAFCNITFVAIV